MYALDLTHFAFSIGIASAISMFIATFFRAAIAMVRLK